MASIDVKISISSKLNDLSNPSNAFFDIFIINNSMGIIIGKLNTAINIAEFSDFDAMLATKVKVEEKPIEPNTIVKMYIQLSKTGLPINAE